MPQRNAAKRQRSPQQFPIVIGILPVRDALQGRWIFGARGKWNKNTILNDLQVKLRQDYKSAPSGGIALMSGLIIQLVV
jgi:hypothetical protein